MYIEELKMKLIFHIEYFNAFIIINLVFFYRCN